jgi:two-component system, chemotaxis family, sensor kinase Cph1
LSSQTSLSHPLHAPAPPAPAVTLELLEAVIEGTPNPIFVKDLNRRFVLLNAACARLLGRPRGELIGRVDSEFLRPEQARHIEAVDNHVMSTGEAIVAEEPVTRDGQTRIFLSTKSPFRNSEGRIEGLIGISRDITDRKLVEEELRRSEEQLRLALTAAHAGAWTWDTMTGELTCSVEWYDIFGLDPVENPASLETWLDCVVPEDRECARSTFAGSEAGEVRQEYRIKRGEEIRWVLSIARRSLKPEQSTSLMAGVTLDVTKQKAVQEALAEQSRQLARSNRDLEHFASMASHDLQEPLRAISIFSDLLARDYAPKLEERGKRFLEFIRSGARKGHELTQSLLFYARAVSVDTNNFVRFSLNKSVDDAISGLKLKIAESSASVVRDELPEVRGDDVHVTLVFQNLIDNAIKYRSDARPAIHISARRIRDEVAIAVRDNGRGIAREFREQVFEPFQRLEARETAGSGIGLTTCKRVVERHGGRIWVESEPDKGSTFIFTLPIASGD